MDSTKQMLEATVKDHNNFYLIEIQNDALSSVFTRSYNLKYFVVLSSEFSDDLSAAVACESAVTEILEDVIPTEFNKKYNPVIFPTLAEEHLMEEVDHEIYEHVYDTLHPNTMIRTVAKHHDDLLLSARVISNTAFETPQQKEDIVYQ